MLHTISDIIFLNLVYLIYCIPILTIGPATTALYAAIAAMTRQESWFKAFRKSFRGDFKRTFPAWIILLTSIGLLVYSILSILYYRPSYTAFSLIFTACALLLCCTLFSVMFLFYSKFDCTLLQLFQNGVLLLLGHPLLSLITTVMTWIPLALFLLLPVTFIQLLMLWLFFYFGASAGICSLLWKKALLRYEEFAAKSDSP